ncbi:DUF262 domain-containing protein [Pseudomonas asiatica]|uniref:DUF262 domain-containing HNH endonuclease family protein n=2 Tax=Pseudomonas TaxID=286 RepID=A0A9X4D427_9PSED|nr:DUF262 domain-containing protein [Pseudomonas asiatica]MDD2108940.1 DUF262 domain-containing HNH endonuclease family protein [Pseudomonas asiatica]
MDIQPDKQNLDRTFASTVYYIDFYQRDYKWTEEPVRRLIDDVFYQFEEAYSKHSALEPSSESINARYPWYYLNTYVTNTVQGKVFVVDGQQRLTTLTLFLVQLFRMAKVFDSKTSGWLERKIAGYSGVEYEFWMNHVRHIHVLKDLMDGVPPEAVDRSTGLTAANMLRNFSVIAAELSARLSSKHKFETFVHYFLYRLVLINLSVDSTHVPMVFEVINDRGVRLKPYEILKGKLLGQIDKLELDSGNYNELWDTHVRAVNAYREDEIDNFFRYWLKSKFSDSRKVGQRFDGDYHREMFKNDINQLLHLEHDSAKVKVFLKEDFSYYSKLYVRLLQAGQHENEQYPAVFFNSLNELDSQYLLILSACSVNDPEEVAKISVVAEQLDRMFSLQQLQGAYDSNEFAVKLFEVSAEIRNKPVAQIPSVFEKHLLQEISRKRATEISASFTYSLFRGMTLDRLNTRFTRFFFGRVERFLAKGMKLTMKHPLQSLVTLRGAKTGFHIEHILSRNSESLDAYGGDEERFEVERNRLGGVLLMKGKDNISSGNEPYADKLKSYANTLYWNETLRDDSYHSKLDFRDFAKSSGLVFKPLAKFGPDELEERHKLLFEIASLIWRKPEAL